MEALYQLSYSPEGADRLAGPHLAHRAGKLPRSRSGFGAL